ncbi:MAG: hypothetical protein PUP91_19095 [Rhizonema sp. PD37]|nr:hypothetical protein [Rhizonema sp. PD37]
MHFILLLIYAEISIDLRASAQPLPPPGRTCLAAASAIPLQKMTGDRKYS